MTLFNIVVLSTCVLVVWLLWLEHREELSAVACKRDDEDFSTDGKTERVQRRGFGDDKQMQIKC
jgi:hypothetical protein